MRRKKGEACAITSGVATSSNHNDSLSPGVYKSEHSSVLHTKIIKALDKIDIKRNAIIPFPEVNRVMSWMFHCGKNDRQILISELERLGFVEVVPFHGIRILSNYDNVGRSRL